jgi:hypothetical protein
LLHREVSGWQELAAAPAATAEKVEAPAEAPDGSPEAEAKAEQTAAAEAAPDVFDQIQLRRIQEALEVAEDASQMLDNFVTWTPLDVDPAQPDIAKTRDMASEVATTARQFAAEAGDGAEPGVPRAKELYEKLRLFRNQVPAIVADGHERLAVHAANRIAESDRLITKTTGWIRKVERTAAGDYHLAAAVDQHELTSDTAILAGKLENLEAQLAGMPDDILRLAGELIETMQDHLVMEQITIRTELEEMEIPAAIGRQEKAIAHFATAEKQCDELLDKIIKHLDSQDPGPPSLAGAELKTLEDLLKMLEDEAQACESLGIPCCRPTNLQIVKDWMKPSSRPGSGGAAGAIPQSQLARQQADRLQRALEDALRQRNERDADSPAATGNNRRWNTLASQLEDSLRQGRGNVPPQQYRRAIEQYFETISREPQTPAAEE